MNVNPTQPKMTTGQKVAAVGGAIATAAAIGTTVYAGIKGKVSFDEFTAKNSDKVAEKFGDLKFTDKASYVFKKLGDGFKQIGDSIKNIFNYTVAKLSKDGRDQAPEPGTEDLL